MSTVLITGQECLKTLSITLTLAKIILIRNWEATGLACLLVWVATYVYSDENRSQLYPLSRSLHLEVCSERVGGRVSAVITEATSTALGTLLSSNRVTYLQYSVSASRIPKNFFALHKYPGSGVASRHRVETDNVSHELFFPNTFSKKSDVPVHFLVQKNSCPSFRGVAGQ